MWHELVGSEEKFFASLVEWDAQQAEAVRVLGCPCGGRLDRADYPRKPRGVPAQWDEAFSYRRSFCCAREGCRRRRTPASVRFCGRRVYIAAIVLACCAEWLSWAPMRTTRRWLSYFRGSFVGSGFWREWRARLMPPVSESELPGSLLGRFLGAKSSSLLRALSFLSPMTTISSRRVMVG